MHQASLGRSRRFDSRAGHEVSLWPHNCADLQLFWQNLTDTGSVLSAGSGRSKLPVKEDPDRKITLKVHDKLNAEMKRMYFNRIFS